jgi:putative sigma-54 modulation protein
MSVDVTIHARDINVSPRLREYVEKKISKLDRYLPDITDARVELSEAKSARSAADRQVAQLTVHSRGAVLRAEERKDDIFAAVDAALDKMHRQIERYKGKRTRGRGNGATAETMLESEVETAFDEAGSDDEDAPVVLRRKRFSLTPMNEAEALEQMQLLGHSNFFVFYNADYHRVNVLYRRNDGSFGLIDTEIG